MATVTFQEASRIYPGTDKPAVDRLDLEIGDGEFLVLVGPSGCGKSTSLRMLAGLEDVDTGAIYIDDREVTHLPPKARDIAMVFQNYALYPHMSVYDNMAFGLKMRKFAKPEIATRVKELSPRLGHQAERAAALGFIRTRKAERFVTPGLAAGLDGG